MMQTGAWRVSYTPGRWQVLAGPTSLVILEQARPQWSDLIRTIWEDVLASASIHDLASRMTAFSLDAMPSFGAFFWTSDGMRTLVRGQVRITDPGTGRVVADGTGVMTWTEVGLGQLERVRVDLEPIPAEPLVLPLVVGVVSASSLLLDTTVKVPLEPAIAPVVAPEPEPAAEPEPVAEVEPVVEPEPVPVVAAAPEPEPEPAPEPTTEPEEDEPDTQLEPLPEQPASQPEHAAAPVDEDEDDWEDTRFDLPAVPADPTAPMPAVAAPNRAADPGDEAATLFASHLPGAPGPGTIPPQPPAPTRRVLAVLRVSTGGRADVDRPVLIGRSPVASRITGDQLPRLLTVPSPSHDISRTHLEVTPKDGGLTVTDLRSTNGTVLVRSGSKPVDLEPGRATELHAGDLLDLGDGVTIAVDHP